jgi:hypothetical protein
MKFAAMAETNRQVIDLKAKRFLDQANHLSGPSWKPRLFLRRPAGDVEVDCLTLLASEATLDSVALYDGPEVLGKVNCRIVEAGIVHRNNSTSIVDKALQCLSDDEALRVRLVSVG